MAKRVTQEDIKKMNKLYQLSHNYSAVARITGFTPATVKRYIIPDYEVVEEINIIRYNGEVPEFSTQPFRAVDWTKICELTESELKDMEGLHKELEL